jgi:Ran GTPase-activating protein (RanGAP) involved in mRNA processing and transport
MPFHELLQQINDNDPKLRSLVFRNTYDANQFEQVFAALCQNTRVTNLEFLNVPMCEIGIRAIGPVLTRNTTLTCLNFTGCGLGRLVLDLINPLKNNKTLTTLKLDGNNIDTALAKDIMGIFESNTSLTTLILGNNKIDVTGVEHLSNMLKTNKTLTFLDLGSNIGIRYNITSLTNALKTNKTLKTLDLSSNSLEYSHVQHIGNILRDNFSLQSLNLSNNCIGDLGIDYLCREKLNLKSLDLRNNNFITEAGVKHINAMLQINETLLSLKLSSEKLSKDGVQAVFNALKSNYTLLEIAINVTEDLQIYLNPQEELIVRNNRIYNCLKPLFNLRDNISLIAAIDPAKQIKKLEKLVPAETISKLNQKHLLADARQIFEALGHIKKANAYAQMSAEGSEQLRLEAEITALQSLLFTSFGQLQRIADLILVHTIFFGLSNQLLAKAGSAFWQLGFFLFDMQWANQELQELAFNVLFNLLNPGKKYTFEERSKLEATTALISSEKFMAILANASKCCKAKLVPIQEAIHHIKSLQKSTTAKQEFLLTLENNLREYEANEKEIKKELSFLQVGFFLLPKTLVYSPCFIAEYEKSFPQKTQFVITGFLCFYTTPENFIIKRTEPGSLPTKVEVKEEVRNGRLRTAMEIKSSLIEQIRTTIASLNPLDSKSTNTIANYLDNDLVMMNAHELSTRLKLGKRKIPEQSSEQSPERPSKQPKNIISLGNNFLHFKNHDHSDDKDVEEDIQEDLPKESNFMNLQ